MKKLIYVFTFIFIFISYCNAQYNLFNQKVIPDAMGYININKSDFAGIQKSYLNIDSFPVFSGFPLYFSGNSFEGGIYCNMDNDPQMELVYNIGYNTYAVKLNGSNVPGWPKTASSYALEGAPAFGDIDGDGYGEIVVTNHGLSSAGYIYAYKRNGTLCAGFPINHGYSSRTPVLADVNNDGKMEIIVNRRETPSSVYIYKGDGTILTGWPKVMNSVPASSCAVGDIDHDGQPEIIAESYYSLYAWKANGDSIPGFPFTMTNSAVNSYSSPVLADLNGDNMKEIIFGTHVLGGGGYVYVIKNDGTVMSGWPKQVNNWIYGPPSVGFIDNDNILDIAVGDQVLSSNPSDYVYGWNKNGTPLTGFPIGPLNAINNQILLADVNNDNLTELIFDDNTSDVNGKGKYLGYKYDGTPLTGWPIQTTGTTFFCTPCLLDINRDGLLDMAGCGIENPGSSPYTNIYLWNLGTPYNASKIYIPCWQYNSRHNGVYGDIVITDVKKEINNIPVKHELFQNYTNPFNTSTIIRFQIKDLRFVTLKVYDIIGDEIETLVSETKQPGTYEFTFDGSRFGSGVYFCKLIAGNYTETKKMLMIK